jgi:hypothetical protein
MRKSSQSEAANRGRYEKWLRIGQQLLWPVSFRLCNPWQAGAAANNDAGREDDRSAF